MAIKTKKENYHFSFIESLTSEGRDPFRDQHFQQTFDDLAVLEKWMKDRKIKNGWTLSEKLSFLRNVESTIRTGAAVRRTQLTWFAVAVGTIGAILGFMIGINA